MQLFIILAVAQLAVGMTLFLGVIRRSKTLPEYFAACASPTLITASTAALAAQVAALWIFGWVGLGALTVGALPSSFLTARHLLRLVKSPA